jgi:hypothetical protein
MIQNRIKRLRKEADGLQELLNKIGDVRGDAEAALYEVMQRSLYPPRY